MYEINSQNVVKNTFVIVNIDLKNIFIYRKWQK